MPARAIGDKTIEVAAGRRGRARTARPGSAIEAAGRGRARRASRRGRATRWPTSRRSSGGCGRGSASCALPELLDEVLEASGYRAMLADGSEDGEERWANLLELRAVTTRYDDLTPEDALDRLLEETALVADQDSYEGDADAVTLITLHAAKGLEFPVVFIAGLEEGVFPHSRALDDEKELEEERRLAYVGITRAKRRLYLSHAWRRATWGMGQASRAVAVPAGDPGRADGRARSCGRRRDGPRPRPRPRRSAPGGRRRFGTPIGGAAGRRPRTGRGAAGPARPPAGRGRSGRRATSRPSARRTPPARRPARWRARSRLGRRRGGRLPTARRAPRHGRPGPIIPGERQFRDGDRVRHAPLGRRHRRDAAS